MVSLKLLMLRLLPHLTTLSEEEGRCLVQMWRIIFRGLVTIGKRDQASDESVLPRFYPYLKAWLNRSQFPALLEIAHSLLPGSRDSSRITSPVTCVLPAKNVLMYALGNKVIISFTYIFSFLQSYIYEETKNWQNLGNAFCHAVQKFLSRLLLSKSKQIKTYKTIITCCFVWV